MPKPAHSHSSVSIGVIAALTNVFFWGIASPIIKSALDIISPYVFLYYRFVIVLALTTPVLFLMRKKLNTIRKPKQLFQMLGIGVLTHPLTLGLLFIGLQYTTAASAVMLTSLSPLFIVTASWIFLKERITRHEVLGILFASIGTAIIVFDTPVQAHATQPLLGNSIILLSNVMWTIGVLSMKKLSLKHSPFLFGYTGWFTGMLTFGAIVFFTDRMLFLRPLILTQLPQAVFPILYMAIFGSIVAFTAYQVAQKHLEASHVSIFTYLQPLAAIPLAYFWLKEQLGVWFLVGAAIIAAGVIIAEIHPKSRFHMLRRHVVGKRR